MTMRHPQQSGFATLSFTIAACVLSLGAIMLPSGSTAITAFQPQSNSVDAQANIQSFRETAPDETLTEAVVRLHTGRQITGFLIEQSDEQIVLRINSIDTTFPRARIANLQILPPVAERYEQFRSAVDDDDVRARLALVEWLRARRAYVLALEELEGILKVEPSNPDARTLFDWISAHLALATKQRQQPAAGKPTAKKNTKPAIPSLTPEQINIIRVFEVDLNTPTRMVVPESTMRELMTRFPESFPIDVNEREAILKRDPIDQLRLLFEHRARDLYDTVQVREDPPSMATFKSRVHGARGWLVNACASNRCHGGSEAGRLQLINRSPNSDETAYTNFVILEQFRLSDGTPLINHKEPARSPMLQMALPRRASLYPHPEIDARKQNQRWRHVFRSNTDRRYKESADWITSLYTPRPDYGFVYPPTNETGSEPTPDLPADGPDPTDQPTAEPG
ncbi:MAG: hypothetical protein AB8F26_08605 [Phycisphaerales bacterium]